MVLAARHSSMPRVGPVYGFVAALLTRMSMRPKRSIVAHTADAAAAPSPAFATCHVALTPILSAACCRPSALREVSITDAPDSANPRAMARPMPLLAPVITATLPSKRISMILHVLCQWRARAPNRPTTALRYDGPATL